MHASIYFLRCIHMLRYRHVQHTHTCFEYTDLQAQSKGIPSLLSTSSRRRQQGRTRRLRHTLTSKPVEGQNLTGAGPNRRRPTECKSKAATAWVERHSFFLLLSYFFLHIFYAFRYGCNSVGFYLSAFYLLCTNASN